MIVLPAIDIIDGQAVRLYQGDYDKKEQVSNSVIKTALKFQKEGAKMLHIVDLDGAKDGKRKNRELIYEIAKTLTIPIEVGGGIRSMQDVNDYLEHGIGRVILGTAAIEDEAFLKEAIATYHERIAVGIDCKNGYVCGRGWLETSSLDYVSFAKKMEALQVKTIIVTDIEKDGAMQGTNLEMLEALKKEVNIDVIASGGVSLMEDVKKVKDVGANGVIIGKAMYQKTIDLKEAIALSEDVQMEKKKIIPCLDMKDGKVVKGVSFVGIKEVGDPVEFAKRYEEQGADELVFLDISATNEQRKTMVEVVKKVTNAISIPLTVGGGIKTIEDMERLFASGVSKVSINSAAIYNPSLLKEAVDKFGADKIVLAIDAITREDKSGWNVVINGGKNDTKKDVIEWAKEAKHYGVYQMLPTSMDADGTKDGYDIALCKAIRDLNDVYVIASGGCGSLEDFGDVFEAKAADAALAASMFHFNLVSVKEVKAYLVQKGIAVYD